MEELLEKARAQDAAIRERSAGAQPAGEADPYRKGEDSEEQ